MKDLKLEETNQVTGGNVPTTPVIVNTSIQGTTSFGDSGNPPVVTIDGLSRAN